MIVSALLVCHDGARWLPAVLDGLAEQRRPVDRLVAVDTRSRDDSVALVRAAYGEDAVLEAPGSTSYPRAVRQALEHLPPAQDHGSEAQDEWIWLIHDDLRPDPDCLAALVAAAERTPGADVLGPKLREWPSLRRLLELGVTISGTGRRETGLERGEYDQGQHDEVRRVLAVNTAGMLVRRSVLEELGGFDDALPIFGNDIDFGWRAARAGHTTLVVPQAVAFHAEAAHRGVRRTSLTGRHTHYQERRAALLTLLANTDRRWPWQAVRLFFGSLLRVLGLLSVRAVGEALDELAAVVSLYGRPGTVLAARRARRRDDPVDVRQLLSPVWVPYRHGLDFLTDLAAAATNQASDVAERRRAAKVAAQPLADRPRRPRPGEDADDEELYADTGVVARFLTNPVAVVLTLFCVLAVVAGRAAFGSVTGGALSPVPTEVGDWWQLHVEHWHALGSGTDVPAPGYVVLFAVAGTLLGGSAGAVVSVLMLLAVPFGLWGAWRLLGVIGHLVDARGFPRWLRVWAACAYALVPVTSGAWGDGRFGLVAVGALLPWLAHAALGFADPDPDRRWRAAWRTGLLLAVSAAFVPAVWLFALLAAALVLGAGLVISRSLLRATSVWGPPVAALACVPVLLAPWLVPLAMTGSLAGLLLEGGRLPVVEVSALDLLTGHVGGLGTPWWLGVVVGVLAVLALLPRRTRVPVLICWLVALAAAVVVAALGFVTLQLPALATAPGLGFFVIVLQGLAIVAAAMGADAFLRRLEGHHPVWQRALAATLAVVAAAVPLGGLVWWLGAPDDALDTAEDEVVPAYMEQRSLLGDEHGVLVVRGSIEEGLTYRIRRGDGVTLGEDEVLSLAREDRALTETVRTLVSQPTPAAVDALGASGIEYVVLPAPVDGDVAASMDAVAGLVQASAEDRSTRAWQVDRPLRPGSLEGDRSWLRIGLLVLQGLAFLVVLVLAGPTLRTETRRGAR